MPHVFRPGDRFILKGVGMTKFDGKRGTLLRSDGVHNYIRTDDRVDNKTDWYTSTCYLRYIGMRVKPLVEPYDPSR
jgi:hypothetical protein